jgi:hypothetical protein
MVFYTDEDHMMAQRANLGISWDTLPSMAVNALSHQLFVFDRDLPFDAFNVEQWFTALKFGKAKQVTELGQANDLGLFENWLSGTRVASRASWDDEILKDQDHDCVVFFYSSKHASY